MKLFVLIFTIFFLTSEGNARQQIFPPQEVMNSTDSFYVVLHRQQQDKKTNLQIKTVEAFDAMIKDLETSYPLYTGMVKLHLAYYSDSQSASKYFKEAQLLLKPGGQQLTTYFAPSFFWLQEGFYLDNREAEWQPIDQLYRSSIKNLQPANANRYALSEYADSLIKVEKYDLAIPILNYEELYFNNLKNATYYDKITLAYVRWFQLKSHLMQWVKIPYENRSEAQFSFKGRIVPKFLSDNDNYKKLREYGYEASFTKILKQLDGLKEESIINNKRKDTNYDENKRRIFYALYSDVMDAYYLWSQHDYKQSKYLLPAKIFLIQHLADNELQDAKENKVYPLLSAAQISKLFTNIGNSFLATGNPRLASQIINKGQKYFLDNTLFSTDEQLLAIWQMGPVEINAAREQGFYDRSLKLNNILRRMANKPDSLNEKNLLAFEAYAQAETAPVFTYLAQQNKLMATDSLMALIDTINSIPMVNEEYIYSTHGWTILQFLASKISAINGIWNDELTEEMVNDLLLNNTTSPLFYPAQLIALKATWFKKKTLHTGLLTNLLFYTHQQLKENFILLSAEERMNFYEDKLNQYFDLYHELLFSDALKDYPEIKEKIITQSLFLKNALADGNALPDELFLKNGNGITPEILQDLRSLKQRVKLNNQAEDLRNLKSSFAPLADNVQNIWLRTLAAPGMDSLTQFRTWQNISAALKPTQLYFETIRYTKTLSDSSIHYGAYLISDSNQISLINLCSEKDLLTIFETENSSAQINALKNNLSRGNELLGKKKDPSKKVNNTQKDLLAELLLNKLSGYLPQKNEWIMVHDGLLNRISFAALKWNNKLLMEQVQLLHWSGSAQLFNKKTATPLNNKALLVGGLQYGTAGADNNNRLFKKNINWPYLPGTLEEIKMLSPIFEKGGLKTRQITGNDFTDSVAQQMTDYAYVHLATHGFYLDSVQAIANFNSDLSKDAVAREPLFRSGLAISTANNPHTKTSLHIPGHLLGYQIANIDLKNCYLVSLSACETGLGDLRNNLGVDGLSRALKIAGAQHLLISLWEVPDAATAVFMQQFYTNLISGMLPRYALQKTQMAMSKAYPVSDWAAFVLIE